MRQGTLPIDSIEALYAADGPSPALRGKGAKPFQRWLAFMKPRVDAGGMRPSNAAIARSLERAEEDRLQESAQRTTTDPSWAFAGPVGPTGLGGSGRLNRLVNRPGQQKNGGPVPQQEGCGARSMEAMTGPPWADSNWPLSAYRTLLFTLSTPTAFGLPRAMATLETPVPLASGPPLMEA